MDSSTSDDLFLSSSDIPTASPIMPDLARLRDQHDLLRCDPLAAVRRPRLRARPHPQASPSVPIMRLSHRRQPRLHRVRPSPAGYAEGDTLGSKSKMKSKRKNEMRSKSKIRIVPMQSCSCSYSSS